MYEIIAITLSINLNENAAKIYNLKFTIRLAKIQTIFTHQFVYGEIQIVNNLFIVIIQYFYTI